MTIAPFIFDIKRHSLHDGPGIRTTVFFKGCQFRCPWCHNPEGIAPHVEIGFYPSDCIGCGECLKACLKEAISFDLQERINRKKCDICGACVDACPGNGLRKIGQLYSTEELHALIMRDKIFYEESGGGITFSGGEATLHYKYIEQFLTRLKKEDIHITVETNGDFQWHLLEEIFFKKIDLIFFDMKFADRAAHSKYTGRTNDNVLFNLKRLFSKRGDDVIPRIPLIPRITATEDNLLDIRRIFIDIGIKKISLLPYNPLGIDKSLNIGKKVSQISERFMSDEDLMKIEKMFDGFELVDM